MTNKEASEIIERWYENGRGKEGCLGYIEGFLYEDDEEALQMAIEALNAKCLTCKRCSDHQESGTRCPIEEHYALPKDGYCHLYEPYKAESEEA